MSPKLIVFCNLLAVVYTTQLHRGFPKLLSLEEIFRHNDSRFSSDAIRSDANAGLRAVSVQPYAKFYHGYVIPVDHCQEVNDAASDEIPYLVSLQWRWEYSTHFCSGAILDSKWVVTAGKCALSVPSYGEFIVKAGRYDLNGDSSSEQTSEVSKIFVHERYNGDVGPYDIALLKLDASLNLNATKYVRNITLYNGTYETYENFYLYGWGATTRTITPITQHRAKEVYIPCILSLSECDRLVRELTGTSPVSTNTTNICTKSYNNNNFSPYIADTGSPLTTINRTTNLRELVGLVSWGIFPRGNTETPMIYTAIRDLHTWINNVMLYN